MFLDSNGIICPSFDPTKIVQSLLKLGGNAVTYVLSFATIIHEIP